MIIDQTICAPVTLLSETLEKYLAIRGVNKLKHFAKYLIVADKIWQEIFQKTIFATQSVWKELKAGDPYSFIDMPKDCARLFSVDTVDDCGNLVPLFYNSRLNVVSKPTIKRCNCNACNCESLCEDLNSTTATTKLLFTINGINYYEKQWIKYCPNGDIIEYTETPVKSFNDRIGDGGDFNNDFNNDFSIGRGGLSNFTIVTNISQRKICALTVRPCGCPENTEENIHKVIDMCGGFLSCNSNLKVKRFDRFLENINSNCTGEVKVSECGNKIYFRPTQRHHGHKTKLPDFLHISYQTNGKVPNQEAQVPDYAELCLWSGIDWLSKQFNNQYSLSEKMAAKYEYNAQSNEVIKWLNPLDLEELSNVQDAEIRF
jgi:hypothetical protein